MKKLSKMGQYYAAAILPISAIAAVFAVPTAAVAMQSSSVKLESLAHVEQVTVDANGNEVVTLKTPQEVAVTPGSRLKFTLNYDNQGADPATNFAAVNPLPAAVKFVDVAEDWADVSVDGGNNYGKLVDLTVNVAAENGGEATTRPATAADVTHVRWLFADAIQPGQKGSVSYRGVVK